jgi:hypothetical protein
MSAAKTTGAVEHQESPNDLTQQTSVLDEKLGGDDVTQVQAASVALTAAIAAQKPNLLSKNMFKLYAVMAIGYLVSTMNGFGMFML